MIDLIFTNWPLVLFIWFILQFLDIWTTKQALARGAREINPIMIWCMGNLGRHGWIVSKLFVTGVSAALLYYVDAPWMLWVMNLIYVGVVLWNWRELRNDTGHSA